MFFYIITLLFLLLNSFKKISNRTLLLITIFLSFFLGFRNYNVGADTERYINYYNYVDKMTGHMELGWNYISIFFKSYGFSAYFFHFIIALITLGLITLVISFQKSTKLNSTSLFFLYTLGYYLLMFNGMRQFLAGSIVFVGFHFMKENKYLATIFTIFLASLFHTSAIFTFPVLFINKFKLRTRLIVITFIISFIFGLVTSGSLLASIAGKYAHDVVEDYGFRTSYTYAFIVGGLTNLFYFYLNKNCNNELRDNVWIKISYLSVIVMNMTINLEMGPRLVYYYSIAFIISIPLILENTKNRLLSFVCYLYGIITFARFIIPEMFRTYESLVPYSINVHIFN